MKAVIALGSNLGNRELNIDSAIAELAKIIEITHLSTNHETDPVGGPEQPKYLNAIAIAEAELEPEELLTVMLDIENKLGRKREVHWGPRTLDLDLITYGDEVIDSEFLVLPHPRAHERRFVLEPWASIEPDAILLTHGKISQLLAQLP